VLDSEFHELVLDLTSFDVARDDAAVYAPGAAWALALRFRRLGSVLNERDTSRVNLPVAAA
jgi:hypothetical protein